MALFLRGQWASGSRRLGPEARRCKGVDWKRPGPYTSAVISRTLAALALLVAPASAGEFEQRFAKGTKAWAVRDCATAKQEFGAAAREAEAFPLWDERRVAALSWLGRTHEQMGELAEADAALGAALKTLALNKKPKNPKEAGVFWRHYCRLEMRKRQYETALEAAETSVSLLERAKAKSDLGMAYTALGASFNMLGRSAEGRRFLERGVATLKQAGYHEGLVNACHNLGSFRLNHKERASALEAYACAMRAAERSFGVVNVRSRAMLEGYAKALGPDGGAELAKVQAAIDAIDALPPPKLGTCPDGVTIKERR